MLAIAARDITLHGRDPKHDLHLSGHQGAFRHGRGSGACRRSGRRNDYRDSTAQDLYDAARLVDNLDNIHFFQRTMVCRDVLDNRDMDLNTLYACLPGTTKHVGTSFSDPAHVADCFEMLHTVAGGEDEVAGAALRLEFQLLRRAADEVRRGKLHHDGSLHPRRHADAAAVAPGRPGPRRRRRSRWPSCRRWRSAWPGWSMSTRSSRALRRSSAPGPSSATCAPGRCRADRPNRRC